MTCLSTIISLSLITILLAGLGLPEPIDREKLVRRHNPRVTAFDPLAPLSLGNGEFAFTVDVTGLQTFPEQYEKGIPLGTQSHWGWHTSPNPDGFTLPDAIEYFDTYTRQVGYASMRSTPAVNWLRANPHRLHLGRLGLELKQADGSPAAPDDLTDIQQQLDLWSGILTSTFKFAGQPAEVRTACHPQRDLIAARIYSPLLRTGQLKVLIEFPYGLESWGKSMVDWTQPERHQTALSCNTESSADFQRTLDSSRYFVRLNWSPQAEISVRAPHSYRLSSTRSERLELNCRFSPTLIGDTLLTSTDIFQASATHWKNFWSTGGAIDLSGSADPRAPELERRIVLSQYLTAIQCAGSLPPQETGLTCNSWFGKFHLEMHWWHAVHFALWGREHLLEKSMSWYQKALPVAESAAKNQGYAGARWPKMVGPDARESPSSIGVFLIWQQPHPIYYAELLYQIHPNRETLELYRELVFQTAEFMADFAHWDADAKRYVLGPPVMPAQEKFAPQTTFNPAFELAYWHYGLKKALEWCARLGLPPNEKWEHVLQNLSALPCRDNLYVNTEAAPNTFAAEGERRDHPALLGVYGLLPGDRADRNVARNTLHAVMKSWHWESTWGWDFPLTAMAAARLGEPELAIDALLMDSPKNTFLPNGHNYQTDSLPLYLPGNGGLLTAVAMMAAGWDGAPHRPAPGFPTNGRWKVRSEGLRILP